VNRYDFQRLAAVRLRDARVLLENGSYDGAYYLVGYAVECALKACIAKLTRRYDFHPHWNVVKDAYTHDFGKLLRLARLEETRADAMKADLDLEANWIVIEKWRETSRYDTTSQQQAEELLAAVSDRRHGVLRWIKTYW
jgi:HEPN domain-containing protein